MEYQHKSGKRLRYIYIISITSWCFTFFNIINKNKKAVPTQIDSENCGLCLIMVC